MIRVRAVALFVMLGACSSGGTATTTTTVAPSTTAAPTTTTLATTTTAPVLTDVIALPVAGDAAGPEWSEVLFLPYGDADSQVGTAPGGEGGSMDLGPEYGAQAADGTWWILDAAKARLARFESNGTFRDAIAIPEDILVGGQYFQFQLPRVLADGTLVAFGFRAEGTAVLRASAAGVIDQILLPGTVLPRTDDGTLAYGFDDTEGLVAVDPVAGTVVPSDWFFTQTGARFLLEMGESGLRIVLPDAPTPVDRVLPIVAAHNPEDRAFGSLEVATTADGLIHVLLIGASEADESLQLGGYFTIFPDGSVTVAVAVRNPFTLSDPGSPAHLGAAFGAVQPWYMVVDTDGVHVYQPAP